MRRRRYSKGFDAREEGGATRLCRHEPLLSTRSNRWDAATAVKASRTRRVCTVLPRDRIPGVLTLGSRGNPTHVEHRRQRHINSIWTSGQKSLRQFPTSCISNERLLEKFSTPVHESHFELLTPRQRRFDALAQLPNLLADVGIHDFTATSNLEQLVRKVQRGHDRDAI